MTDAAPAAGHASTSAQAPAREPAPAPAVGVLVVGYGNPLRGDDGVGPRVAELVAADPRLAGATVVASHQLTPELADEMRTASLVVLVDARAGAVAGSLTVERVEAAPAGVDSGPAATDGRPEPWRAAVGTSSHHVDPGALAALADILWGATPETFAIGVGATSFETGDPLSPEVERALARVVDAVAALVTEHGRA